MDEIEAARNRYYAAVDEFHRIGSQWGPDADAAWLAAWTVRRDAAWAEMNAAWDAWRALAK